MNENWITLTDLDVFAPDNPERKTIAAAKRRDDLAEIVSQVTAQVRQAYELSNRELGEAGKIPEGLKARAIAVATWRFVSEGVPKLPALQTKERQELAKAANDYLDRIARQEIGGTASPSVSGRRRDFSRREQEGL